MDFKDVFKPPTVPSGTKDAKGRDLLYVIQHKADERGAKAEMAKMVLNFVFNPDTRAIWTKHVNEDACHLRPEIEGKRKENWSEEAIEAYAYDRLIDSLMSRLRRADGGPYPLSEVAHEIAIQNITKPVEGTAERILHTSTHNILLISILPELYCEVRDALDMDGWTKVADELQLFRIQNWFEYKASNALEIWGEVYPERSKQRERYHDIQDGIVEVDLLRGMASVHIDNNMIGTLRVEDYPYTKSVIECLKKNYLSIRDIATLN